MLFLDQKRYVFQGIEQLLPLKFFETFDDDAPSQKIHRIFEIALLNRFMIARNSRANADQPRRSQEPLFGLLRTIPRG